MGGSPPSPPHPPKAESLCPKAPSWWNLYKIPTKQVASRPFTDKKTKAPRSEAAYTRGHSALLRPWYFHTRTHPPLNFCCASYHCLLLPGLSWGQRKAGSPWLHRLAPHGNRRSRTSAGPATPTSGASLLVALTSWLRHCRALGRMPGSFQPPSLRDRGC